MKYHFLPAILLFFTNLICAQTNDSIPIWYKDYRPLENNFADTISIDFIDDRVIMPVSINNQIYRFMFDTGVTGGIMKPELLPEGSSIIGQDTLFDTHNAIKDKKLYSLTGLTIGKLHFPANPVIIESFNQILGLNCAQIDGIIGGTIFQHLKIKIDTRHKQLILTDRENWYNTGKANSLPILLDRNCPFIDIYLGEVNEKYVMFDTGDNGFYTLSNEVFEQIKGIDQDKYREETGSILSEVIDTTEGKSTIGLFGQMESMSISQVKFPVLKLNDVSFTNVHTTTSPTTSSHIGAQLLRYGEVVLDYPEKRFIFLPYENKTSIDMEGDDKHASIGMENGHIVISLIREYTDEYKQGIRRGDWIKEINQIPLNDDICTLIQVLRDELVHLKVINKEGKEIEYHASDSKKPETGNTK